MDDKFISIKCSNCGANLTITSDREVFFCEFCGQKHFLKDVNHHKYTYHKVDDARIREADVKESIRLEELRLERIRLEEDTRLEKASMKMRFIPLSILALVIIGLALLMVVVRDDLLVLPALWTAEMLVIIVAGVVMYKLLKKS